MLLGMVCTNSPPPLHFPPDLPPLPAIPPYPPAPHLGASSALRVSQMFMGAWVNDGSSPCFGRGPSQILSLCVYNMPTVSTM